VAFSPPSFLTLILWVCLGFPERAPSAVWLG
jgi:hypothetical protein